MPRKTTLLLSTFFMLVLSVAFVKAQESSRRSSSPGTTGSSSYADRLRAIRSGGQPATADSAAPVTSPQPTAAPAQGGGLRSILKREQDTREPAPIVKPSQSGLDSAPKATWQNAESSRRTARRPDARTNVFQRSEINEESEQQLAPVTTPDGLPVDGNSGAFRGVPTPGEPEPEPASAYQQPTGVPRTPLPSGIGESREATTQPATGQVPSAFGHGNRWERGSQDTSDGQARIVSHGVPLAVEVTGPDQILLGQEASYLVELMNPAPQDAQDVIVRVAVPATMRVIGYDSRVGVVTSESPIGQTMVMWRLDHVSGNSNQQLAIKVVPEVARASELTVEWVYKPKTLSSTIAILEPKLDVAISGPSEIRYGETHNYKIRLSNPGTGPATDVQIQLASAGQSLPASRIGTLQPGESKELEIEVTAEQAGQMVVQAMATAAGGLQAQFEKTLQIRQARLQLQIDGAKLVYAGSPVQYQLRVANTGDATAMDVVAQMNLPAGAKFIAGTTGAEPTQDVVGWRLGDLAPGTERILSVQCELTRAGANQLTARAETANRVSATESMTTTVDALADLKLHVNDPKGPVPTGREVVYELEIVNRGSKAAQEIYVVAQFSEGIEPVSASGVQAELVPGQVLFQAIPRLGPGERKVLKVIAKASQAGSLRFRAEVKCGDPETHLVAEESTRYFGALDSRTEPRTADGEPTPAKPLRQ